VKRFPAVAVLAVLLSAWVGAQGPRVPSAAEQSKLLERNRSLYRAAIDGGLNLMVLDRRENELYRAQCYTQLAKQWAREIEQAASAKDADRVTELGQHLTQMVDQGVVPNLQSARKKYKSGSEAEKELFRQRDEAVNVLKPLEESLKQTHGFEGIVQKLTEGRTKVEQAAKIDK
jgi:hypothetical protein